MSLVLLVIWSFFVAVVMLATWHLGYLLAIFLVWLVVSLVVVALGQAEAVES